jgi:FdhD protein
MPSDVRGLRLTGDESIPLVRTVIDEAPIQLRVHGLPYVALMATAADLDDLACGFALTDGLAGPNELLAIDVAAADPASIDLRLVPAAFERFLRRRQNRVTRSYSSCGVCGVESATDLPPSVRVVPRPIARAAIRRALGELPAHQPLNRATGAAHAAAFASPDGEILLAREDVGRHNALDKLIGARCRAADDRPGFCIITSRCSYEMVQKATAAEFPLLVAVSAPTRLAIDHAKAAGLALVALARTDSQLLFTDDAWVT